MPIESADRACAGRCAAYIWGMLSYTPLSERALLAAAGPDARRFLNGLVTVDVLKLAPEKPRYAALLSPQGKFLHDFFLLDTGDAVWIDTARAKAEELAARLKRYKLKAQVEVMPLPQVAVYALWGDAPPSAPAPLRLIADPRYAALGWRLYGEEQACRAWLASLKADAALLNVYEHRRIMLGIPDGEKDLQQDRSLILEAGFEALRGVDFDKGCYVGQEVTARSKFRAHLRKRFYTVRGSAELPVGGGAVMQGEKDVGRLGSVMGCDGIAMLRTEAVESDETLVCEGVALDAALPPWADAAGESAGGIRQEEV